MSYISVEEQNKIRESVNIVDIISSYVSLTQAGKNFKGVCPFHDDHSPSMSVSAEKQIFKCFVCETAGNVFSFVSKYENVSYHEAIKIVADKSGITLENYSVSNSEEKNSKYFKLMELANKYFQNNLKTKDGLIAKKYLNDRDISDDIISEFGIGVASDSKDALTKLLVSKDYSIKTLNDLGLSYENNDQFKGRITFPLHDEFGNIIGFSARIYRGENLSKYINTKETLIYTKGNTLYNYHLAKTAAKKEKCIILVEGQMDAIRLSSVGIKNVVATGGTSLTKEQINLLKKLRVKIILCLDNDTAGENATFNMGSLLEKSNLETLVIRLSDEKDPDEYIVKKGVNAFQNTIKSAISFFDYKLYYLKNNKNLNNSEDLAAYINEVLNDIKDKDDEVLKEITINKLSEEYKIDVEVLRQKIKNDNTKVVVNKEKDVKPKTKKNKYELACEKLLYYMMNDSKYIKIYQKQLSFIPIKKYRDIVNEILYYYEMNKTINLADFISYANSENENINDVMAIISNEDESDINMRDMELFIQIIKEYIQKEEIEKLKKELANELDVNKKVEIAMRITKLKKGSVEND